MPTRDNRQRAVLALTVVLIVGFTVAVTPFTAAAQSSGAELGSTADRISFEESSVGASKPADPWYMTDTEGISEISDARSTDGTQSLHLAGASGLGSTRANLDVNLTGVSKIKIDGYVQSGDVFFGDIKVNVDNNDNTIARFEDESAGQWYEKTGNVSGFTGNHTLVLWTRGEDNEAYFDNIRFYDSEGKPLKLYEVLVDMERIAVNAEQHGGEASVTQETWKGEPSDMIDTDGSTQWQVAGNPGETEAIFDLRERARVTGDFLDIGTGGDRAVNEYELYVRDSSDEQWELATTVTDSITSDGGGTGSTEFDEAITGSQFKLVLTDTTPPELCFSSCDVPIADYRLLGEFVDDTDGDVVAFTDGVPTILTLLDGISTYADGGTIDGQEVTYEDVLSNIRAFNAGTFVPGPVNEDAAPDVAVSAPDSVQPGETFTVEYTITNSGSGDANAAGLDVTPLPDVQLTDAETGGSTALERGSVFFTDGLSSGATETVTLEFTVAEDAESGQEVTIEGVATVGGEDADVSTSLSIGDGESDDDVVAFGDANGDGVIDLSDLLTGINIYDEGGTIDGQEVTYEDVLSNIRAFNTGESVPGPVSDGAAPEVAVSAPDSVQPGETFTVDYEITNSGTEGANAAGLDVTPLPDVQLTSAETGGSTALQRGSVFFVSGLSSGTTETVTLEFTVAEDAATGQEVTIEGVATVGGEDADASTSLSIGNTTGDGDGSGDGDDSGDEETGLSATRTIESQTVPAGESTEVTVTIQTAATTDDLRFTETFDPALSASIVSDDGATISSAASDEVAASWGGVSEATITYEVTVPENASDGTTYDLSGTVEDRNAGSEVSIDGDSTIEVGEPSNPAAKYANNQGVVGSTGLLDAAADFREGEISSRVLLDVAAAFRSGKPVA